MNFLHESDLGDSHPIQSDGRLEFHKNESFFLFYFIYLSGDTVDPPEISLFYSSTFRQSDSSKSDWGKVSGVIPWSNYGTTGTGDLQTLIVSFLIVMIRILTRISVSNNS